MRPENVLGMFRFIGLVMVVLRLIRVGSDRK